MIELGSSLKGNIICHLSYVQGTLPCCNFCIGSFIPKCWIHWLSVLYYCKQKWLSQYRWLQLNRTKHLTTATTSRVAHCSVKYPIQKFMQVPSNQQLLFIRVNLLHFRANVWIVADWRQKLPIRLIFRKIWKVDGAGWSDKTLIGLRKSTITMFATFWLKNGST